MSKPVFLLTVLMIWELSQTQTPNPINIFNPQVGQSLFLETTTPDSAYYDSITISVVRRDGDTGFVTSSKTSNEGAIYTSQGVTTAPMVLVTGGLDTNGIYSNEMEFPVDYTSTNQGEHEYGFVLDYEVKGFRFDTLLVSCYYMAYLDAGDRCDFVTPSGIWVQYVNHHCFCINPGPFYSEPSEAVLQIAGGQTSPVIPLLRTRSSSHIFEKSFNLLGRIRSSQNYRNQISVTKERVQFPHEEPVSK